MSRGARARSTLHLTNTAWLQEGLPFVPAYLDTLAVNYGAGVSVLDFARDPEAARQTINDALARATEQRIQDLLPRGSIDSTVKLVLSNTVYFNAEWKNPFDPTETAPGAFRLEGGGEVAVPFMHRSDVLTRGTEQPGYDAVELSYNCAPLAMTLIAPKAGTFEAFERAFDVAALAGVDAAMEEAFVNLRMPRFRFRWGTKSLVPALKALGMKDAFAENADLTGLTALRPLFVQDVMQQTFVAVDERGTEAAAAAVGIGGSTGGKGTWLGVTLDRPFLFLVRHTTTGQILFLGRVVDPR